MKILANIIFVVILGLIMAMIGIYRIEDYRYWVIFGIALGSYIFGYIRGQTDEWTLWKEKKNETNC